MSGLFFNNEEEVINYLNAKVSSHQKYLSNEVREILKRLCLIEHHIKELQVQNEKKDIK